MSQTGTLVRPAEHSDIPGIIKLAEATGLFPADVLLDLISGYLTRQKDDVWIVHEETSFIGRPILTGFGFCEIERAADGVWNLMALAVDPSHQRRGIGSKMVQFIESELTKQETRLILVETASADEFERTSGFLKKVGFVEEARIREYYEKGVDKVVFRRHLRSK